MKYINMYLVNAFTDKPFSGNATGVIISASKMTDHEMQNTARDLNLSETVYIKKLDTGHYYTRFFTPNREISLCGHATIATFYAICQNEYILPLDEGIKKITQHTKCGKIPVELEYENRLIKNVYMTLRAEHNEKLVSDEEIASALNISLEDISLENKNLLPKKIRTGMADIVIPVKSLEILEKINPNFEKIREISEKEEIISFQVFTFDKDGKVRQRTFSPSICVDEEAGSGTSTANTLYYLNKNYSNSIKEINSVQGIELKRKSELRAEMIDSHTIRVGGRAFVFMNGVLTI